MISERVEIYQNLVLQKFLERSLHKGDYFFHGTPRYYHGVVPL